MSDKKKRAKKKAIQRAKKKAREAPQLVAYKARVRVHYQRTRDIAVEVEGWDKASMQESLAEIVGLRMAHNVFDTLRGPA